MPLITLGDDTKLKLKVPSKGDTNWESDFKTEFAQKIVDHDHTGVDGKGAKIAEAAIEDGAITTNKIADGAVTSVKIAADAVADIDLAPDSVGTSELKNDAVETANILDANVTTAKIADANITEAKLATGSVTNAKIGANAVVGSTQIVNGSISGNKLQGDPMMGGAVNLSNLADVTGTSPTAGQILKWTQTNWDGMGGYQWAPGSDNTSGGAGVDEITSAAEAASYTGTSRIIHITATEDVTFGSDLTDRLIIGSQDYKLILQNVNLTNCDINYFGDIDILKSSATNTSNVIVNNCNIRCASKITASDSDNTSSYYLKIENCDIDCFEFEANITGGSSFVMVNKSKLHASEYLRSTGSTGFYSLRINQSSVSSQYVTGTINVFTGASLECRTNNVGATTIIGQATLLDSTVGGIGPFTAYYSTIKTEVNVIASTDAGPSIPHNTTTKVIFEDIDVNSPTSYYNANGNFVAPVKGRYVVNSQIAFGATSYFDAQEQVEMMIYVNGAVKWRGLLNESVVSDASIIVYSSQVSAMVNLDENDVVDVRVFQNSGVARSLIADGSWNYLHIHKIN